MLFTLTYTGEDPSDLGYLLHKNPARPQTAELSFGRVHVFYPETGPLRCTAALLLDMDPLDLVRGRKGAAGIFDYVNDRPYVCSSFMCTAMSAVYGTAMSGRCAKKQALADSPLDLSASLFILPCRDGAALPKLLFEPLGYEVHAEETTLLDERFPEWGNSPYINLTIRGKVRLRELLNHLYVLIPVFDRQKHYWIGEDEVDKLLSHGRGWLQEHPEKALIARRYFKNLGSLARSALDRLGNGEGTAGVSDAVPDDGETPFSSIGIEENEMGGIADGGEPANPVRPKLNTLRLEAVLGAIKRSGASSVIDLGCGEGNLLWLLMKEKNITRLAGVDVSRLALERARNKLKIDRLPGAQQNRISLFQSSLTYRDKRFRGYDAAALVEVMEHLEENRLDALAAVVFGDARPGLVVISAPNVEYNELYGITGFRHGDHRFEWDRARFQSWARDTARRYGYEASFEDIGEADENRGAPTQMGVFEKIDAARSFPCA